MSHGPLGLVLLAVVVAGCGRGAPVRVDDLSVVVITLDAAGARYFGTYGNMLPTSPNVDALARDGGTVSSARTRRRRGRSRPRRRS